MSWGETALCPVSLSLSISLVVFIVGALRVFKWAARGDFWVYVFLILLWLGFRVIEAF